MALQEAKPTINDTETKLFTAGWNQKLNWFIRKSTNQP